jgi:hypothetical protein
MGGIFAFRLLFASDRDKELLKSWYISDNFKSLTAKKEEKKEEGEFEQQRKATIAEALQAKEEKSKTFGGGQKQVWNSR